MQFTVMTGEKWLAGNALKSGDRNATRMQSKEEHDRLIDPKLQPEYRLIEKMPPGPQKTAALNALDSKCKLREAGEVKYWTNDKRPRRPIAQSSSWVGDINFDPERNMITIALGDKGTSKTIYGNEREAADIVNAEDIGRYVNRNILDR